MNEPRAPGAPDGRLAAAALVAVALPTLIAYNVPPSATFFNQVAAVVGWGILLMVCASALPPAAWRPPSAAWPLLAVLVATAVVAALASLAGPLPWSLSIQAVGMLAAATLVVVVGAACARAGIGSRVFDAFCIALLAAGVLGSIVGFIQVYAPGLADATWIAAPALPGRAAGNLRQPNHLSSLLLWSLVALAWLADGRRFPGALSAVAGTFILFVIVLTGSRTGALDAVALGVWGIADSRLARRTRIALGLAPVLYALLWLGLTEWAHLTRHVFSGEARFSAKGDISASRFGIWENSFALLRAHPLFGVGFGDFNFAWTLTPFPGRPVAFFDHAHNLPLHLMVELGVPLATLLLVLLLVALWRAYVRARDAGREANGDGVRAPFERAALVIVLMAAIHSQFEYPLWYAYFLLPTAFAWGLCLSGRVRDARPDEALRDRAQPDDASFNARPTRPLLIAAMMLVLGGALALYDYARVVVIFAPPADAGPLEARIEAGRHSWLFAPHADYAAATTADHPSTAMPSFKIATHYLLDARLMMAWATALEEAGDDQRARYLAQRLREFRNPGAALFFAPCEDPSKPDERKPFQCKAPTRDFTYRDFL